MLTIRQAQLASLEEMRLSAVAREWAAKAGMDPAPAAALVIRMARAHDLVTETDVRDVVAIGAALDDVDFDQRSENAWIHAKLRDPAISSVSRRLAWVLAEVRRRQALARHNAAIEAGMGHLLRR